jgi:glycosylphosphatidylinositol transamidase (GPIT) subunit GPI8
MSSEKAGLPGVKGQSVDRSHASNSLLSQSLPVTGTHVPLQNKTGFMAVIVDTSRGWINYRHESDALTMYRLLRANGVDDDRIILMTYDDIPYSPQNPLRGDVHNIPDGMNIRTGAGVDYTGARVNAETFRNVLTGNRTPETPVVMESNASTDVFVYIASHGAPGDLVFGAQADPFTTADFTTITGSMYQAHRYRQMVFFVDTCFGESIASDAKAPGLLYLTGAARNEPSLGAIYDSNIKQWLSDEFTSRVVRLLGANPRITFRELYPAAYEEVTGSHVRMITTGNVSVDTPVMDYLSP